MCADQRVIEEVAEIKFVQHRSLARSTQATVHCSICSTAAFADLRESLAQRLSLKVPSKDKSFSDLGNRNAAMLVSKMQSRIRFRGKSRGKRLLWKSTPKCKYTRADGNITLLRVLTETGLVSPSKPVGHATSFRDMFKRPPMRNETSVYPKKHNAANPNVQIASLRSSSTAICQR